jgi:2-C-methyl-D-erythritol 2,4-cyclodiphosphate synthase
MIFMHRVGLGYDVHRFVKGRKLVLGGVTIPYELGLDGHSDADVLLHAICDALLGAVGKGDIGEHFPNTDERYRGVSSMKLLGQVHQLLHREGYVVGNVDAVILAQAPALKEYKKKMAQQIAGALSIDVSVVNIKATTNEGMGFVGRQEGIAAYAAVLVVKRADVKDAVFLP